MKNTYMRRDCDHCYHLHRGPLLMVVPNGHVVLSCCKCKNLRTQHADHYYGRDSHDHHEGGQWTRWPRGRKYTLRVQPNTHPPGADGGSRRWNAIGQARLGL